MKMKKEVFLSCKSIKAKFIAHFAAEFRDKHIIVIEASDDAVVVIVQTAIETEKNIQKSSCTSPLSYFIRLFTYLFLYRV